ncbi:diptericin A [Drosophila innubila]|uniref:diptericin A n=1 Tax=Drosophila innubila TaxID=198719 RepID=UPI00148B89B0|nr:diptericin A [Drosophila innubila]
MQFTIVALVCCLIGSVLAYPSPYPEEQQRFQLEGGYNSDKSGRDFGVQGQIPVWTSDNKRHEFDVAGHYGQHFGGPYGNSEPSYGYGGVYRFRF